MIRWTPAMDDLLRERHAAGDSELRIGNLIEKRYGLALAKSSVATRARRLGLQPRDVGRPANPIPELAPEPPPKAVAPAPILPQPVAAQPPEPPPFTPLESGARVGPSRECVWPIGDPRTPGFRFCQGSVSDRSYCREHYELAYVRRRRRDDAQDRLDG